MDMTIAGSGVRAPNKRIGEVISTNINNPVISSFRTSHQACNKSSTTGNTGGAGSAYSFEAPEVLERFFFLDL